ncbi:hypothetical protein E2I00_004680, partial [Balaenoptera physalus]
MELGLRGDLPGVKDGLREVEEPSKMVLAEEQEPKLANKLHVVLTQKRSHPHERAVLERMTSPRLYWTPESIGMLSVRENCKLSKNMEIQEKSGYGLTNKVEAETQDSIGCIRELGENEDLEEYGLRSLKEQEAKFGFSNISEIDYSPSAIQLSGSIIEKEGLSNIKLNLSGFHICIDKGTFDAISLNPDNAIEKRKQHVKSLSRVPTWAPKSWEELKRGVGFQGLQPLLAGRTIELVSWPLGQSFLSLSWDPKPVRQMPILTGPGPRQLRARPSLAAYTGSPTDGGTSNGASHVPTALTLRHAAHWQGMGTKPCLAEGPQTGPGLGEDRKGGFHQHFSQSYQQQINEGGGREMKKSFPQSLKPLGARLEEPKPASFK